MCIVYERTTVSGAGVLWLKFPSASSRTLRQFSPQSPNPLTLHTAAIIKPVYAVQVVYAVQFYVHVYVVQV